MKRSFKRNCSVAGTLSVVLGAVLLAACGGSQNPPAKSESGAVPYAGANSAGEMCPMQLAGTQVAAEDTQDGVAMVFTTSGDVSELRRRVRRMAEMHQTHMANHSSHMGPGGMGSGGMGSGGMMGSGAMGSGTMGPEQPMGSKPMMGGEHMGMHMVPSAARTEDVDGGARIVLTPEDPARLAELRAHAREHAAMMAKGQCPMKHGQG